MKIVLAIIVLSVSLVASAYLLSLSHRYEVISGHGPESFVLDTWTGKIK